MKKHERKFSKKCGSGKKVLWLCKSWRRRHPRQALIVCRNCHRRMSFANMGRKNGSKQYSSSTEGGR